ncbi:hypothetical protein A0J61_01227 [Choanephora cucurbitarum]|uniref:C2H2-type domain-containing protein n=1 Tax=Choanephora cucurbitarum TaxID=101091 RepID=A0A1C7NTA4_9FUNG|nr:hypothetical protein A0J61_01227 [Choanephora cucurbitarum]
MHPNVFRDSIAFSSIENHQSIERQRQLRYVQPDDDDSKENIDSHLFISSLNKTHPKSIQIIPSTFNNRAEPTSKRPTMGGKTIGAIQQSSTTMSSEELKLLSRRIDPHQPLASPHASPTKPPLPPFTSVESKKKKKRSRRLLECVPCCKVYKTRAGLSYHLAKCAHRKKQPSTIVQCICSTPLESDGTMIECVQCRTWLHTRCVGGVAQENRFCCPRCDTTNQTSRNETEPVNESEGELAEDEEGLLEDGRMISLSALYSAQERDKNPIEAQEEDRQETNVSHFDAISLFSEEQQQQIEEDEEDFQSLSLPPSSIFDDQDFTQFDWCQPEEVPSLLFSSDNTPSYFDDIVLSSTDGQEQQQADWFHFANFELDFTSDI